MIEIRIHGRGGQGAVTASQILAIAAFHEGKECQAFPNFGVERRGAPSTAFVRIDDKPIHLRSHIYTPDIVLVLDASLVDAVDVAEGLKKDGLIIINSNKEPSAFKLSKKFSLRTADATSVALRIFRKDIVNTAMLGAFAKATGIVSLKSCYKGITERFHGSPDLIEKNKEAIKQVYNSVK